MSINHYSSDTPETTLWWPQQQQATSEAPILIHPSWHPQFFHQPTWLNSSSMNPRFNLNNQVDEDEVDDDDEDNTQQPPLDDDQATATTSQQGEEEEKESMFEKPLTPSDVGKLNRLVIPKQHAEKYFPLGGGDSGETKGLLLSFEDESGKCWRFRYSYWNSSQSYVLTKGWSRYVKDKRLDAGDVVLFQRHRFDANRLFIAWRRRQPNGSTAPAHVSTSGSGCHSKSSSDGNGNGVGGCNAATVPVRWTRGFYSAHPYPTHHPLPYQPDCLHAGGGSQGQQNQTTPVGNSSSSGSSSSSRVLRLFGVNMECQPDNDSETCRTECS